MKCTLVLLLLVATVGGCADEQLVPRRVGGMSTPQSGAVATLKVNLHGITTDIGNAMRLAGATIRDLQERLDGPSNHVGGTTGRVIVSGRGVAYGNDAEQTSGTWTVPSPSVVEYKIDGHTFTAPNLTSTVSKFAVVYTVPSSTVEAQNRVELFDSLKDAEEWMNGSDAPECNVPVCPPGRTCLDLLVCQSKPPHVTKETLVGVYALSPIEAKQVQVGTRQVEKQVLQKVDEPVMEWRMGE
jgi:hypothetical protein